jgi:hypothetical protein
MSVSSLNDIALNNTRESGDVSSPSWDDLGRLGTTSDVPDVPMVFHPGSRLSVSLATSKPMRAGRFNCVSGRFETSHNVLTSD